MRQLATVRTVSELIPIEGADRIELAKLDGWQCVVKKGDFHVGDPALYFEIDSILPSDDERFAFLEPRKYRIKSMKLRGALSQGLLMPLGIMTEDETRRWRDTEETLSDIFRVQKYEVPVPIGGEQKGNFPTHLVPKTDQERIQNIPEVLEGRNSYEFEITEKLDGTSLTCWYNNLGFTEEDFADPLQGEICRGICVGVASRNWEMKRDDDNVYARLFNELELESKLHELGRNIAIQGEIIGPRVQGNKYKRGVQEFYVFDIYDIDEKRYLWPVERIKLADQLGLRHVPILTYFQVFNNVEVRPTGRILIQQGDEGCKLDLDVVLAAADGKSQLHKDANREGLVFKHHGRHDGTQAPLSFKAISNKFLLKNE